MGIPEECIEFKTAFEALRDLNWMCSQEILPGNYTAIINRFSNKWLILADKFNLSTPPKLHIIIDHLDEYYSDTNLSLVKTSDQLIENMHQYVHKVMSRSMYIVKHPLNPQHGKLLLKAVKHINSMNVIINKTCL